MESVELIGAIEALVFAAGEPVGLAEVRGVFARLWRDLDDDARGLRLRAVEAAWPEFRERWSGTDHYGFSLVEVAGGVAFRSNPCHADVLRAMRDERPLRLSKPALEIVAIVAYRQPITKAEIDQIRGVDCGGTLKTLLERNLVGVVGKKEDVGRPSLYGTTGDFLSVFNLASLAELPSLREFHELNDDSAAQVEELDKQVSLEELSQSAKQLRLIEEPAVAALDLAVDSLKMAENQARGAFSAQGIVLNPNESSPG